MIASAMMSAGSGPVPVRPSEPDWEALLSRIAAGEQQALAQFYDQTSRLVYSIALRVVGNPADAEEVTLDVYSQVWRSAPDYSPQRGSPMAWLIMIARSRSLDRVRSREIRQGRETGLDAVAEARSLQESAEETALLGQMKQKVRGALNLLSAEQRQAIEMAFFGGLSHSELAEKIGEPLGTVKTRIRLGMMRLRQALSGKGGVQ